MELTTNLELPISEITNFLTTLQDEIISAFMSLETEGQFEKTPWEHPTGGGGTMAVLRGKVFEKAAVNFSSVHGDEFPLDDASGPYFATGVSLITHMNNPHAPTVHMNVRFIQVGDKHWFGGGYDLTPMGFPYEEDTHHFHSIAEQSIGNPIYRKFSDNAKKYFYIPHRKKERGVGGLFFDKYNSGDFDNDYSLWRAIANSFIIAIIPIYQKRINQPFTEKEREKQLQLRGHYAEFNLLYDRGTKFGFKSGGNPDAILCSMPPIVKW